MSYLGQKISGKIENTRVYDINSLESPRNDFIFENNEDVSKIMKNVVNFFKSTASVSIKTPFEGTCLKLTKDEKQILFASRSGRIAIAKPETQEIIADEKISDQSIWCLNFSQDEKYIYAGGQDPNIVKYLRTDLSLVETYKGHTGEINSIIISADDNWMFSASDDGTVRMWNISAAIKCQVILYESRGIVYSMDLSADQKYICSGGQDCAANLYELNYSIENPGKLIAKMSFENGYIWAVKFFPSSQFFATGDSEGRIKVYSVSTFDVTKTFDHRSRIRSLDISISENILVSAAVDNNIMIWDLHSNHPEIVLKKHTDWVKAAKITKDQERIISLSDDKHIIIWKIPSFDSRIIFDTSNLYIISIWFSKTSHSLEAICKNSEVYSVFSWDTNGKYQEVLNLGTEEITFSFYTDDYQDLVICKPVGKTEIAEVNGDSNNFNYCISIYYIKKKVKVREHLLNVEFNCLWIGKDKKYCFIGENYKFSIWNYYDFTKIYSIFANKLQITNLIADDFSKVVFSYGSDQFLKKFKLNLSMNNLESLEEYSDQINGSSSSSKLMISEDQKYLYFVSDASFRSYEIRTMELILMVNDEFKGLAVNLNSTFFLARINGIDLYSSKNFQLLSNFDAPTQIKSIILSDDYEYLYYFSGEGIMKTQNFFKLRELTLVGEKADKQNFLDHVMKVIQGSCYSPYSGSYWLIEPVHINLLHLYSYFNLSSVIKDGLLSQDCKLPYIASKNNLSPLSISIKMNFPETTQAIVDSIRKVTKTDETLKVKLMFEELEESLADLNLVGYNNLHKLYNDIFIIDLSSHLPNSCDLVVRLPMYIKSDSIFLVGSDFNLNREFGDNSKAIIFSKTLVKFYLEIGSARSLEFMRSLDNCKNEKIFETKLIRLILSQKWKKVRYWIFAHAFIYAVYLILLTIYAVDDHCYNSSFLIAPFLISAILHLYELIFISLEFYNYFQDFWNILDVCRSWTIFVYSVLIWSNYFSGSIVDSNEKFMLSLVLFLAWMRGLTYFTINSSTRYLIKLLFKVVLDLVPYLIILLYSGVAFGLVFQEENIPGTGAYFDSLTKSYLVILSKWDQKLDVSFYAFILLIASLLNPVINLNLIISILNDTYDKVKQNQVIADAQELTSMITEVETLMFWSRHKNTKSFLQIIEKDYLEEDDESDVNGLIKEIRGKIFHLEKHLYDSKKSIENLDSIVKEKSYDITRELRNLVR